MIMTLRQLVDQFSADAKQGVFRPPPINELAEQLNVKPTVFHQWFHRFQTQTGCTHWFQLNIAQLTAFLCWLKLEGYLNE
jgi:hypothetical protein